MKNGTTRKAAPTQYGIELPNFQYSRPPMTGPRYRRGDGAGGGVYHFFRRRVFL